MRKKKGPVKEAGQAKEVSNPFKLMLKNAEERFGARTYTGEEGKQLITGVELPSLSLMYLFDSNVVPFSKMIGIAGPPQCQKSSLAYDFSRMVMGCHGGGALHFETEGEKYSPTLAESIVGMEAFNDRFCTLQCTELTEAQKLMTEMLKQYKDTAKHGEPVVMIVDSLSGADAGEMYDKIKKDGYAGRDYSISALSWTRYLRVFCADLVGFPVVFLTVNHLKTTPPAQPFMPPIENTPGGKAQWFHSAIYLYVHRTQSEQRLTRDVDGEAISCATEIRTLKLTCKKTSIGKSDGRYINVDFIFYCDTVDGVKRQVSLFDWDASTAYLLQWLQCDKSKGAVKSDLRDICDVSVVRNRFTSKKLGVENLSPSAFGKAVHADKNIMVGLLDFLNITEHKIYDGAMPTPMRLLAPKEVYSNPMDAPVAPPVESFQKPDPDLLDDDIEIPDDDI